MSRWSTFREGSLEVLSGAARLGARGLAAAAGTGCAVPDSLVFTPPPATLQGMHEACREISAAGVEVVAPGATLRAGETISLGEGFSTSADLTLAIEPTFTPFSSVTDNSPQAESSYVADFHLRFDDLALAASDRLEHFVARATGAGPTFRLVLQADGAGGIEALLEARRDDGSLAVTPAGQEVALAAGWHEVRLIWQAGAGNGFLSLVLDGTLVGELSGLVNGARRVDSVDWGVVGGSFDGPSGTLDLDAFASWN